MRRAVVGVAVLAAMFGPGSAASADSPALEFSTDGGTSWSTSPPTALFDPGFRFVPGDSIERTLLFRSTRAESTAVVVTLDDVAVSEPPLAEALTLTARDAEGNGLDAARLAVLPDCQPLIPVRLVATNEPVTVSITIDVSTTLTGRVAQGAVSTSNLLIGLTDAANAESFTGCAPDDASIPIGDPSASPRPTVSPSPSSTAAAPDGDDSDNDSDSDEDDTARPDDDQSGLARTGLTIWTPAIVVAVTGIGAGLFLLLGRRRRSRS